MSGKPYQTYDIPNSRLVKNASLFDALVHDLKNNQKILTTPVYQTKSTSTSSRWLKRLKSFCKSKLQPCKQSHYEDETLATLSSTNNNRLNPTQLGSCFMLDQSILLPLTAIDAEAIYQDISLSRTSSLHHSQVLQRDTLYDDSQLNQKETQYASNYSEQYDTAIKRHDTGPIIQGAIYQHLGDSLKKKSQGAENYQQQKHPDVQEVKYISPTVHNTSFYPHYTSNHYYSPDKLSLSAGTTATSSLSPSSSSLGVYQCNNTNYLHKREPDDTYSTFNSIYSTFATSTSNATMCTDTAPSSSLDTFLHFNSIDSSPRVMKPTTQDDPVTSMTDSVDISPSTSNIEASPAVLSSPDMADPSFAKLLAKGFWDGKQTVCEYEMIATWLGTSDPFRASVLRLYMDYFDFTNQPLDEAFRNLCTKLFFKAESQQMDRIIEVFAKRFWECNPTELYHSADVVYAVSYSLLLLNTDLHGVQEHHQKMKKARFVKNTMETITALVFPSHVSGLPNMNTTKVKRTEGDNKKIDGNPISIPTRPPSIDTSTLSRKNSLGERRQIRKTKSHHNLSPFVLNRSSFWRGGGSGSLLQPRKSSDNDGNTDGVDNDEDEDIDKNTIISGDSNTFAILCKAMKEKTPKSQSLVDLPYYLKQRYTGLDGDRCQTRDERRWLANIEQLLKVMYTSIKSKEIIRIASPLVDLDASPQEHSLLSADRQANELKNKQRLTRRKRGRSAPPPPTASTTPTEYWISQDNNDTVDEDGVDDDTTRGLYSNASTWSCQDPQKLVNPQKPLSKKLKTFLPEDSTATNQDNHDNPNLSLSGWVMRKCLMQGTQRKAKQRNWKRCHLKIQQGKLVMQCSGRRILSSQPWINPIKYYRHGSAAPQWRRSISVLQYGYGVDYDEESDDDEEDDNDGDDNDIHIDDGKSHVTLDKEEMIDLNHSLSRVLPPPGWHGQRNHVVCLQMTDGASWLFQVHTHQKAQAWTAALNYWAALHSKEPLAGGVTNVDYGWNTNFATSDGGDSHDTPHSTLIIPSWEVPASCLISSRLSKKDQLEAIDRYIDRLIDQADHHRNLRKLVEKRYPPRTPNGVQSMANWELKMQYLLFEKIKFQTYRDALASHVL